jgi:hypothetical protein
MLALAAGLVAAGYLLTVQLPVLHRLPLAEPVVPRELRKRASSATRRHIPSLHGILLPRFLNTVSCLLVFNVVGRVPCIEEESEAISPLPSAGSPGTLGALCRSARESLLNCKASTSLPARITLSKTHCRRIQLT